MKSLENHAYLTYKEITRQQQDWRQALELLSKNNSLYCEKLGSYADRIWIFTGCGTSYYLALTASAVLSMLTDIHSIAVPASEVLIKFNALFKSHRDYLFIPISRSGVTTETVQATAKVMQEKKLPVLAVTCDSNSALVQNADISMTFPFVEEKSVVMTSSFSTLLLGLVYIAFLLGEKNGWENRLWQIIEKSSQVMKEHERTVHALIEDPSLTDFIFLGQGPFYGLAREAALKVQEMSICTAQGYHSLEFRHGPQSTITPKSLVTFLISNAAMSHEIQLAKELKDLGARIFMLHNGVDSLVRDVADVIINAGSPANDVLDIFLYTPLLQLLGFYRALSKGINPDSPRHLNKVVTFTL